MAANLSSTARGREPTGQRLEPCPQGDMQAISQEGDEDMGFDALFEPMIIGRNPRSSLSVLKAASISVS